MAPPIGSPSASNSTTHSSSPPQAPSSVSQAVPMLGRPSSTMSSQSLSRPSQISSEGPVLPTQLTWFPEQVQAPYAQVPWPHLSSKLGSQHWSPVTTSSSKQVLPPPQM